MNILGIDPSLTATGFCVVSQSKLQFALSTVTPKSTGLDRLREIANSAAVLASNFKIELVVIEGIAMMATGNVTELAGLHWLIRDRLARIGPRPILIVAPSQLKKFVLGKGTGEKSHMLREVYKRWDLEASNDNEADAVGLAMIGRAYCAPEICENEAQRQVIEALRNPKAKARKARKVTR